MFLSSALPCNLDRCHFDLKMARQVIQFTTGDISTKPFYTTSLCWVGQGPWCIAPQLWALWLNTLVLNQVLRRLNHFYEQPSNNKTNPVWLVLISSESDFITLCCALFSSIYAHHSCPFNRGNREVDPNKILGRTYWFALQYVYFSHFICQKSLEIYCTFLIIFSASGDFVPQSHPFFLYKLAHYIQNGSTPILSLKLKTLSRPLNWGRHETDRQTDGRMRCTL